MADRMSFFSSMAAVSFLRSPSRSSRSTTRMPDRANLSTYAGPIPRPVVPMASASRQRSLASSSALW